MKMICVLRIFVLIVTTGLTYRTTHLYLTFFTEMQPNFGIKNQQLRRILDEFKIPYIDLSEEQYKFPSTKYMINMSKTNDVIFSDCGLHKYTTGDTKEYLRCSLTKCHAHHFWIKQLLTGFRLLTSSYILSGNKGY